MFARLLAAVLKEIIVFWRDPRARAMLFAMPAVQVMVFGLAATLEVRHVELAILNEDAGRWSQEMIARDYVNAYLFQLAKTGVANAKIEGLWENSPNQSNDLTAVHWVE